MLTVHVAQCFGQCGLQEVLEVLVLVQEMV